MILEILGVSWLNLRRDWVALALTFVMPIVFFSIFALVFGEMDRDASPRLEAALVVEDDHDGAVRFRSMLLAHKGLRVITVGDDGAALDRTQAVDMVRRGEVDVAVVIPPDLSSAMTNWSRPAAEIRLFTDAANPLAEPLASGLLQAIAVQIGLESLAGVALVEVPRNSRPTLAGGLDGPVRIRSESVLGEDGKRPSVAFFAAGLGVMFLLFAMSGRGAIVIEERENGVLTRLLASRVTLTHLLLGRWLFLAMLGFVQVSVMFVWGSLVFDLDLWTPPHLIGFVIMTAATAAAAAGFGLLLAGACKSRTQLNGVSSVLILIMSVIGGSMFPRFLMPEQLQRVGLFTFNAWALDGYQKIFWYESGLRGLAPQLLALTALTVIFLVAARQVTARQLAA